MGSISEGLWVIENAEEGELGTEDLRVNSCLCKLDNLSGITGGPRSSRIIQGERGHIRNIYERWLHLLFYFDRAANGVYVMTTLNTPQVRSDLQ